MLGVLTLLACLALGWQAYLRPVIGLVVIGLAFAVQCLFGEDMSGLVLVGGVNIYAGDLASLIVFKATLWRLTARPWRSWGHPMLVAMALGLVLFQSFARGISAFGIKAAGLGFRGTFITYTFLFFGLAFLDLPEFQNQVKAGMKVLFAFLVGTILVRWALVATGLFENPDWGTSTSIETRLPIRVIFAGESILLAQISLVWLAWRSHERAAWLGLFLLLLLQHRSVWLAALAGGGYIAFFHYRNIGIILLSKRTLGALVLSLIILGLALTQLPGIRSALGASITSEETWAWRVAGWAAALSPDQMPPLAWFLGKPVGAPTTRFMLGHVVDVGFHSHYVATVVQTGLLGLAGWLILWGLAWRGARNHPWATMLVLSQLVYGVPYSLDGIQGLILALSLAPGLGTASKKMQL